MGVEKTLQNLQDGYAHLLDLMVVLVDEKRLLKTKISYPKKGNEEFLAQQMIASIPALTKIKSTIYVDVLPGLKVLAAPIITNSQERLYLIGGMLVEDEIFDALKNIFKSTKRERFSYIIYNRLKLFRMMKKQGFLPPFSNFRVQFNRSIKIRYMWMLFKIKS